MHTRARCRVKDQTGRITEMELENPTGLQVGDSTSIDGVRVEIVRLMQGLSPDDPNIPARGPVEF